MRRVKPICSESPRSSAGLSAGCAQRTLPLSLPQAAISPRLGNELQPGAGGLGDVGAAGALRLLKKLSRSPDGDLTGRFHEVLLCAYLWAASSIVQRPLSSGMAAALGSATGPVA